MTHGADHLSDGWCMCGKPCCVDGHDGGRCLCPDCKCRPVGSCEATEHDACYRCRPMTATP
jgi:hypothetical protein